MPLWLWWKYSLVSIIRRAGSSMKNSRINKLSYFLEIHIGIIYFLKNINSISELQNCFKTTYEEGFVLLCFKIHKFIHLFTFKRRISQLGINWNIRVSSIHFPHYLPPSLSRQISLQKFEEKVKKAGRIEVFIYESRYCKARHLLTHSYWECHFSDSNNSRFRRENYSAFHNLSLIKQLSWNWRGGLSNKKYTDMPI